LPAPIAYCLTANCLLPTAGKDANMRPYECSSDTIRMTDFGLAPDSRVNAVPYVQKALDACKGKSQPCIVFPQGPL